MLMKTARQWELVPNFNIGTASNTASKNKSIVRGIAYHNQTYRRLEQHVGSSPDLGLDAMIEPWFREILPASVKGRRKMCQPDAVLIDKVTGGGIVVEVKLNWKDGRDEKLIDLYLDAAKSALGLDEVWPVLITKNLQGYKGVPLLGLKQLDHCFAWRPGLITPLLLLP